MSADKAQRTSYLWTSKSGMKQLKMIRSVAFKFGLVLVLVGIGRQTVSAQDTSASEQASANNEARADTALGDLALTGRIQARNLALAFQAASSKMMPSVVTVLSKRKDVDGTLEELDWLSEDSAEDYDLGSGVIITSDGLCVTNHHVVKFGKSIRVRLSDGRTMMGSDLRSDPSSDIAVFKLLSKQPLPAATMGDSDQLIIGDWVMAIGSPFSLDQTVSVGIISSKGRSMRKLLEGQLLQTDATINPGNSGGALLDLNGDLVGINTAIATTSGQFQGVGFAIPIRRVQWITKELVENGKVRRSKLGVRVDRIPQDLADELNLGVQSGVYVTRVVPDNPAEQSGVLLGDIILSVGDQKVPTPDDFRSLVEQLPADRDYSLKILRDGAAINLSVTPVVRDE
jgi:serine protease Do